MVRECFALGLRSIERANDLAGLDEVRKTVDRHGEAGNLTADEAAALAAVCRVRCAEIMGAEGQPAAPPMPAAKASTTRPATSAGIPNGFVAGEYAATVVSAVERTFPDSGVVLTVVIDAVIAGERVAIPTRFDERRDLARKAAFRSAGVMLGAAPDQLVGRSVRVEVDTWQGRDGASRLSVRRWISSPAPAAGSAIAARAPASSTARSAPQAPPTAVKLPPKPPKPEWEEDEDDSIPF